MDSKKYSLSQIIVIRLMTAALICLFMTFISCQGADDAGPENVSVSEEAALESPAEEETKAEDAQEAAESARDAAVAAEARITVIVAGAILIDEDGIPYVYEEEE